MSRYSPRALFGVRGTDVTIAALVKAPPDVGDLPAELLLPLAEVERRHCLAVLEACNQNRTEAACILGIDRKTLHRRLFDYGVTAEPWRPRG